MIIAVEGMDGAGKTTVCKYISSHKNFHMIEKPTKYFFNKHDFNKVLEGYDFDYAYLLDIELSKMKAMYDYFSKYGIYESNFTDNHSG